MNINRSTKTKCSDGSFSCMFQNYFPVFAAALLSLLFSLCVVHYAFGNYSQHYSKSLYVYLINNR